LRSPGPAKDTAGVIAPPPLIYAGVLAAAFALDWAWPLAMVPGGLANPVQYALGAAVFAVGGIIAGVAARQFSRAGTSIPPWRPTTALVTDGPYRWSRNPMYVALTLAYVGIGVAGDNGWVALLLAPLLALMRFGVIAREEAYLARTFGDSYRDYTARVRRWL
jgi:protein-S-isoprenylcysteine O-methyltransferase Ste14